MSKYFVLLFVSLVCVASEPTFHFMDCVKIVNGFYKGCKGNVTEFIPGGGSQGPSYTVEIEDCKNHSFEDLFSEKDLEVCKK